MIKVNAEKCIGCGKCIDKCLMGYMEIKDGKSHCITEKCIKCMHCASACPENAICWDEDSAITSEELPIIDGTFIDDLESFLLTRRSYRMFSEKPVPYSEIEHALVISKWAPSAKNQHPVKYIVVNEPEKLQKIMDAILEYCRETGESPEVVSSYEQGRNLVFAKATSLIMGYSRDSAVNPSQDTALALEYIELVLQSRGIGTCWGGYLTRFANKIPALKEFFHLPEGHSFYGTLFIGYPTEDYLYIPKRVKEVNVEIR